MINAITTYEVRCPRCNLVLVDGIKSLRDAVLCMGDKTKQVFDRAEMRTMYVCYNCIATSWRYRDRKDA